MPNDAKLGLVLGTGLVIIIAVVFFRKDSANAREQADRPAASVNAAGAAPTNNLRGDTAATAAGTQPVPARGVKHTVKPDHLEPGTVPIIPEVLE